VQQETTSIWTYVMLNQSEFINVFYRSNPHVLVPNCSRARMVFWSEYYLRWSSARPQYLVDQQHFVPAGEAYQLFAMPRSSSSSSSAPAPASSGDPPPAPPSSTSRTGEEQSEESAPAPTSAQQQTTEPRPTAEATAPASDARLLNQNETP
jgi:hypothetical protein